MYLQRRNRKWICAEEFNKGSYYDLFYGFLIKMVCINDSVERNIRLIQDFVAASKKEDHRQDIMLLAKKNRSTLTKDD